MTDKTHHHLRETKFKELLAQTNDGPFLIDVEKAEGIYIWDKDGKRYTDMISGVGVNNIGHSHPKVINAIKEQLNRHMHVMVYGEFIQDSQLAAAERLSKHLPEQLNCTYFVNSGTEANEGALKLAKRFTGRTEVIACKASYHGSTHGSLSATGNETKKNSFRPLLPDIHFVQFNVEAELSKITEKTAAFILEPIQGDAGVRIPSKDYLKAVRKRCSETGTLLIFDEVQTGIGRCGSMFAFEHFDVVPDILTLGKALGGGMPVGAFVSSKEIMHSLTSNPMLGHITTFGGHPVICAAVDACLEVLETEDWIHKCEEKGALLEQLLAGHSSVKEIRRKGLLFAIELESAEKVQQVVEKCLEKGVISFWFLSNPESFRLAPPLSISLEEIRDTAILIKSALGKNT
jgi:acetylornithine/succinyldiaminopimelate/putrescine aminotransferase